MKLKRMIGSTVADFLVENEEFVMSHTVCLNGHWYKNGKFRPDMYASGLANLDEIIREYKESECFLGGTAMEIVSKILLKRNGTLFVDAYWC